MRRVEIGWGARIAVLYGGFVVLMVTLVTLSMKQDFSLVSDQYYQEELVYQNTIDASKNTSALSGPATVSAYTNQVVVRFPADFFGKAISGAVHFYSPVATSFDRKFDIAVADNAMHIDRKELSNGRYIVKLNWTADGKQYYQETDLTLR